jgi:proteasome lid subunit RPN8/RPN11
LPVFVDLDAMQDMEDHALSDTGVELGGVMLGGQHRDEAGQPFVLVTDSLRARHYESTKGSFKFTHDTWSEITRARDEFPDELQMVGWYHTHPDWGVFLSGMDLFICDHFFNKPLDVALVIDPCRQDRGFFQWTGDPSERLRRTGGFHLVASRFRQAELEEYVAHLEGKFVMSGDPRFSRASGPAPIVQVGGEQPWQSLAMLGMLAMQFCFLMLISWRVLVPAEPPAAALSSAKELSSLQASIDRLAEVQEQKSDIDAKLEVLDKVLGKWDGTAQPIVQSLAAKTSEAQELRSSLEAHEAQEQHLDAQIKERDAQLATAAGQQRYLEKSLASAHARLDSQAKELDELRKKLAPDKESASEPTADANWKWIAGGVVVLATLLGTAAFLIPRSSPRRGDQDGEAPAE